MSGRAKHSLVLLALYVVSFGVRVWATEERVSAGHGDVAGYFHVAKNLYAGRGFVQDYIADYLQDPKQLPAPSNTWWLPLPSIIAFLGLKLSGGTSYAAAKLAMIAVASLIPILVYLAGLSLLRSRVAALACGIVAVGFHLYLDQPTATLSHGPYALFAGGAVVLALSLREHPRWLPLFGLLLGFSYLTRGDSRILVVLLAVTLLWLRFGKPRRAIPWRGLAVAGALFVVTVAPWWARNVQALGSLMPEGQQRVIWARSFEDWFTDPAHLTPEHYLEWGWPNILDQKTTGVADAVEYVPFVMHRSVIRKRGVQEGTPTYRVGWLGKYVMTPLLWIGVVWLLLRRRAIALLVLLHIALLVGVYGVVYPSVGRESFRSGLFSVFPVFIACMVAALSLLLTPLRAHPRLRDGALLSLALLLSAANAWAAKPHLDAKARDFELLLADYREFGAWAHAQGLSDETFFLRNVWQFTCETELKGVMIPQAGPEYVVAVAKRFGIRYLVDESTKGIDLGQLRPGVAALIRRHDLVPVPDPPPRFRLYRFPPRVLAEDDSR